ncbi:hypothetical protein [Nannocystis bainbridge]|uniref:DUF304 domain-containing protein n=1 Tax=Nannocystis bainbridge TaxID=2995303 RepID=A0ABT5E8P5_9BACT|nr:hypothetical protein [Nannocystis bainbridge]MDC0721278.1 hypothetical protein [Nannocystis bainbridge]
MPEAVIEDPFRPFTVEVDDGTRLVLSRRRTAADWRRRVGLWLAVVTIAALQVLIFGVLLYREMALANALKGVSFLLPLYICLRVVLYCFLLEAPLRIVAVRGEVTLEFQAAARRHSEPAFGLQALEARPARAKMKRGAPRWLELKVRTHARTLRVGSLDLDPLAEPIREAAAQAAAAKLAALLGVPLELRPDPDADLLRDDSGVE